MLCDVLTKYELLFDRTPGTRKKKLVDIEIKPGAKPYYAKPHLVPRAHKAVFHKEVEQLCQIGVFKKVNRLEWG